MQNLTSISQKSSGDVVTKKSLTHSAGRTFPVRTVTTLTSGATVTYSAAACIGGLISDTISAGCAAKVPAPADVIAAIPGCVVGSSFEFDVLNTAATAIAITMTANGQSTIVGTATINQANNKRIKAIVTSLTSPAVAFYMLGSQAT